MIGTQGFFPDSERALVEAFRIRKPARGAVEFGMAVEGGCYQRMSGAEVFLTDRQCAFVEGLRLRIAVVLAVKFRQIIQAGGGVGMIRSNCLFRQRQGLLDRSNRALVVALLV